jgi:hypothetical protein
MFNPRVLASIPNKSHLGQQHSGPESYTIMDDPTGVARGPCVNISLTSTELNISLHSTVIEQFYFHIDTALTRRTRYQIEVEYDPGKISPGPRALRVSMFGTV